jgi:hypothetical protein
MDQVTLHLLYERVHERVVKRNSGQTPIMKGEVEGSLSFPIIRTMGSAGRSLACFPEAFHPIAVVVGDRREEEPETPGDVLAYPASSCDLMFLLELGLPKDTPIVSDKVFMTANDTHLRKRFGQVNLLIIGSPASNHLARKINQSAIFRFYIDPGVVQRIEDIEMSLARMSRDELPLWSQGRRSVRSMGC